MTIALLSRRVTGAALLPAALCLPQAVSALGFSSTTTTVDKTHLVKHMADCGSFKLKQVTDDAAARTRSYWFDGICKIWVVHVKAGVAAPKTGESALWAEARVTWHSGASRLEELVKLTDPGKKHSGTLRSEFKCTGDPVVQDDPCVRLEFKNLTDWSGFSVPAEKNRPLLSRATTGAEANKLAAMDKPASPSGRMAVQQVQTPPLPQGKTGAAGQSTPDATAQPGANMTAPGRGRLATLPAIGAALPDLASGARVVVAGKHSAASGAMLALPDTDARTTANGVCQVAFEHEVRNLGAAGSPASDRQWTVEGSPGAQVAQTPAIAAGAAVSRVDTIGLRPGVNKLRLRLDPLNQLKEASKANNEFTLTVSVAGLCGGAPLPPPQAAATDNLRFSPAQDGTAPAAAGRLRMPSGSR